MGLFSQICFSFHILGLFPYIQVSFHPYMSHVYTFLLTWTQPGPAPLAECVLQCIVVCCSVLQCVAVCCRVWQCVAVRCSVLQCVAVCCSVLQCAAVCCRVWQCVAVCPPHRVTSRKINLLLRGCEGAGKFFRKSATHCNTLQHAATRCNTTHHTATHRSTLQHTATHCNTLPAA